MAVGSVVGLVRKYILEGGTRGHCSTLKKCLNVSNRVCARDYDDVVVALENV